MKREEFKLLIEDWKRNFVTEDELVSNTLNEGYTELDRMILEEGLSDLFNKKVLKDLGLTLSMVAALSPIAQRALITGHSQMNNNPTITQDYKDSHTQGGIHSAVNKLYSTYGLHSVKAHEIDGTIENSLKKSDDYKEFKEWADKEANKISNERVTQDSDDKFTKANNAWNKWMTGKDGNGGNVIIQNLGNANRDQDTGINADHQVKIIMINYFMKQLESKNIGITK